MLRKLLSLLISQHHTLEVSEVLSTLSLGQFSSRKDQNRAWNATNVTPALNIAQSLYLLPYF